MNRRYRLLLLSVFSISLLAFITAAIAVAQGRVGDFGPLMFGWGFLLYSAFIWGDVLIFSLLWMALVPLLFKLKNPYYFLLVWGGFWLIRGSGEVIYSFLQQFHPAVRPYAAYLSRSVLLSPYGPAAYPKYWVIEQIFFQSVTLLAFITTAYALCRLIAIHITAAMHRRNKG